MLGWLVLGSNSRTGTAGLGTASAWQYLLTQCYAIVQYLRLAVVPHPLVFDYGKSLIANPVDVLPRAILIAGLCVVAAACGGSTSSPTSPESPRVLQGRTVSAIDGSAAGQVSIQVGSRFAIQSDADGNFQIDVGGPGTFATVFTGSRIVERRTTLTGPTADRTSIPLIP